MYRTTPATMRKQEFIHTHGLLLEIANTLRTNDDLPAETLDTYRETGVTPTSIHRSKTDHKVASLELAHSLAEWCEAELDENVELEHPDEDKTEERVEQWMVENND